MKPILIVDYGMANLRSVQKAFEKVGHAAEISGDPNRVAECERLVLPGVGAFRDAIARLNDSGLADPIREEAPGEQGQERPEEGGGEQRADLAEAQAVLRAQHGREDGETHGGRGEAGLGQRPGGEHRPPVARPAGWPIEDRLRAPCSRHAPRGGVLRRARTSAHGHPVRPCLAARAVWLPPPPPSDRPSRARTG